MRPAQLPALPIVLAGCTLLLFAGCDSLAVGPTDYVGDNGAPTVYRVPPLIGKTLCMQRG